MSRHHDKRVEHFIFLSPANLTYMMSGVTKREAQAIEEQVKRGDGDKMLPFPFMGWVECIANTAYDWYFSGLFNDVHTDRNGDFSQAEKITHSGALLVGTYDNFTDGDPSELLRNLNDHMPSARENQLIFIEKTGHTYQGWWWVPIKWLFFTLPALIFAIFGRKRSIFYHYWNESLSWQRFP